jgi:hypothetical protein
MIKIGGGFYMKLQIIGGSMLVGLMAGYFLTEMSLLVLTILGFVIGAIIFINLLITDHEKMRVDATLSIQSIGAGLVVMWTIGYLVSGDTSIGRFVKIYVLR